MTIIGGCLQQMFNGCFYLWANVSIYVISYMYIYDKSVNQNAIFYVDAALSLLNVCGYQVGAYLLNVRRWNPKFIIALGGMISLGGITLASYQTNLWNFMLVYGVSSGIGCGMTYMIPIVCSWEYFP